MKVRISTAEWRHPDWIGKFGYKYRLVLVYDYRSEPGAETVFYLWTGS